MKSFLIILLFICYFKYIQAASWMKTNAEHSDVPGFCFHEETKHAFAPGEIYKPIGICEAMYCTEDLMVVAHDCSIAKRSDCKPVEMDLRKQHPYCCTKYICNDIDGKEYETQ